MLTIQQIKADPEGIVARLAVKGFKGEKPIARVLALDDIRRGLQLKNDNAAAELNRMAASIGKAMKEGRKDDAEKDKAGVAVLKEEQRALAEELARTEQEITEELLNIPNVPCAAVPEGTSAADNVVELTGGPMPELGTDALPHWELAKKYNQIGRASCRERV